MKDYTLEYLLDLDGIRFVVDEHLGYWVKFEVYRVDKTLDRPHGIRYSLSLHDRFNQRIMGFDNSHAIEVNSKRYLAPKRYFDHWHETILDKGKPYFYTTAAKLLENFWSEVEKITNKMKEKVYESSAIN